MKIKYTIQEKILFIIVASIAILIFAPFSVAFFLILAGILILLGPIGWALLAMLCIFIYLFNNKRKFRRLVISCFLNFSHFHTLF